MVKKLPVLILLFVYFNSFLFIPQVDEIDSYTASGKIKDDINSVYEFIDHIILQNPIDENAGDEDDDKVALGMNITDEYCPHACAAHVKIPDVFSMKNAYRLYIEKGYPQLCVNIFSPPPEILFV